MMANPIRTIVCQTLSVSDTASVTTDRQSLQGGWFLCCLTALPSDFFSTCSPCFLSWLLQCITVVWPNAAIPTIVPSDTSLSASYYLSLQPCFVHHQTITVTKKILILSSKSNCHPYRRRHCQAELSFIKSIDCDLFVPGRDYSSCPHTVLYDHYILMFQKRLIVFSEVIH